MKKNSVHEQIQGNAEEIRKAILRWEDIHKNGCNDPSWPDGVNLNLVHNHVCYFKNEIRRLCTESGENPPPEFYLPTPPVVDSNYLAKPKSENAKRLMSRPDWKCATPEPIDKKPFDDLQMSLF
jgi:hypothetical protein